MRLTLRNGKEILLYEGQEIDFELSNPLFNEVGSHSSSFMIPWKGNRKTLGIYDVINQVLPTDYDIYIELENVRFEGNLSLIEAYDSEGKYFLSFHTGYFNKSNQGKKMKEIDYGGKISITQPEGENPLGFYLRHEGWTKEDGFAIFPVYMPNLFDGSESEVVFTCNGSIYDGQEITVEQLWKQEYSFFAGFHGIVNKHFSGGDETTFESGNFFHNIFRKFTDYNNQTGSPNNEHGVIIPFPFLEKVMEDTLLHLGYNIVENIFEDEEDLQKMVIFNNRTVIDKNWSAEHFLNIQNHVPDTEAVDFLEQLKNYIGVLVMPSLLNNEVVVTSFKTLLNSTDIIDITEITDTKLKVKKRANGLILFEIGNGHVCRPNKFINGHFLVPEYTEPDLEAEDPEELPMPYFYDTNLIRGEYPNYEQYDGTEWLPLERTYINEYLNVKSANKITTEAHSLEQIIKAYWYNSYDTSQTSRWFVTKMPTAFGITGATAHNKFEGRMSQLCLLYYRGNYQTIVKNKMVGGNFGTGYTTGLNGEPLTDKSLQLDRGGVVDKWQNELVEWTKNRKNLVLKTIEWKEHHLTKFMFNSKYRVDNTNYFINKIKGSFVAGDITKFDDTELYSI